jgi:hypothetical protein
MATEKRIFGGHNQARGSRVTRRIEVDVPFGVTVASATATHSPPTDGTLTTPTVNVTTPYVDVTFDSGDTAADVGDHVVSLLVTLSDGQKWDCDIEITVYR